MSSKNASISFKPSSGREPEYVTKPSGFSVPTNLTNLVIGPFKEPPRILSSIPPSLVKSLVTAEAFRFCNLSRVLINAPLPRTGSIGT